MLETAFLINLKGVFYTLSQRPTMLLSAKTNSKTSSFQLHQKSAQKTVNDHYLKQAKIQSTPEPHTKPAKSINSYIIIVLFFPKYAFALYFWKIILYNNLVK